MNNHILYIHRCLQLARLGVGSVAPNPMVGAVLVYQNRIIGEGWHQQYGKAHAEVNCINSVKTIDKQYIPDATMYVSLEPCAHYGKTPPCADLIIKEKIKKVVVGCVDPFAAVNGGGIAKLRNAGIEVITGDWHKACADLNKRFFTFHQKKRPYILLKWAETSNKIIAPLHQQNEKDRLHISNNLANHLVHKWRSEEAAILIGKNTAVLDNPALTNRMWVGKSPIRLIIDRNLQIPQTHHLYDEDAPSYFFNQLKEGKKEEINWIKVSSSTDAVHQILDKCYELNIQSILVEGGAFTLQSFIQQNLWDECRIITNRELSISEGIAAPKLAHGSPIKKLDLGNNSITFLSNNSIV